MEKSLNIPSDPAGIDRFLRERESVHPLREGTEAKIIWNADSGQQTEYAIVYLHGFRASHPEGDPVHRTIAEKFGWNLFLSRMAEHGVIADYPLLELTEEKMLQSARFALEIGRRIGKKVILMGTSTGASLALWLASQPQYQKLIHLLVLYSPLIRFYGIKQNLLMNTPVRGMLRLLPGKKYQIRSEKSTYAEDRIWGKAYSLQGALVLSSFVEHHMKRSLFARVKCPAFIGYYYKSTQEQDKIVSVPAIKEMISALGTRTEFVKAVNFPSANSHVICSSLLSRAVPQVIDSTEKFLKKVGSHGTRANPGSLE